MPRVAPRLPKKLPSAFEELVRLLPPKALRDTVDYRNTQEMIDALTSIPRLSKGQLEYLDTLTVLFEAYEAEHHDLAVSDVGPIDALRHLVDEHGMTASDLGRMLGEGSLGSKVLSGQRDLSKGHIRILADYFGVRADLFL